MTRGKHINRRDKMLQAVNKAAELLLTIAENEDIEIPLEKSMEIVCRSAGADRVYIWRNEIIDADMHFVCEYCWLNETGKKKNALQTGSKISYKDRPMFKNKLLCGKTISGIVSRMPKDEQEIFMDHQIKSICMIPLFLDKHFWGIFSIDDCRKEREFREDEIAILNSVSLMLASAINHHSLVVKQTYELALQTTTLTTLFNSIPDLIFTKDLNFRFMQCNKSLLEHFNKTHDDLIGKTDKESLGYTEEEAKIFEESNIKTINEGRSIVVEEYIPRADGTNPLYETIKMPLILDGEVVGIMGIARDITKRKETEAAALAASRSKSSFLANMSHEIRTPMNAILGVTELLIQYTSLPSEIEEGLGKIYSSCDMLLGIINDILDFSKIEAGKMDIMPARYKVANMINDSMQLNMMHINSKPIEFELQINENVPANLIGDELRIKQILNNLLSNAFKYTDSGKVTMSVSSEAISGKNEIILILNILDTGRGMKKEQLNRLYKEYSRFEPEKPIEGTGLGLFITQQLLNLMNGEIHAQSEPGKGTLFTIRLPQITVDKEVLGREVTANFQKQRMNYLTRRKRGQIARNPMPYGSVLIVDDVETNLYVAVGLLKLYKLKIDTATSGQEALDKIKNGNVYDIIFMDHMMPEMDGIETAKRIRQAGYNAPIVALTANALVGQADIFLQNGFDEFISKPIDTRQLNSILNKLIRDKQNMETLKAVQEQKDETDTVKNQSQMDILLQESFIRDARRALSWLDVHNKSEDFKNEEVLRKFTIIIHGIKSSLWNIGEAALAELAYKLEDSARAGDIEQILSSIPNFTAELRGLVERLESNQVEYEAEEDSGDLLVKMQAVMEMCTFYNRKGALDILSDIKKCSKETKDVVNKIKEYVLHSDFEEAEAVAMAYADKLAGKNEVKGGLLNKEIDGLDIKKGLERYDGDEKTYLMLLRSYVDSVNSMLKTIETVSGENLANYRIKVHGIKGTSLDIFAEQIGKEAKKLEDAAKTGDLNYIYSNNVSFLEKTKKLVSNIEKVLSSIEAENPKARKDKPDKETLLKLLDACKNYDINEADKAMADIEKYQYESDGGLADWLERSIAIMNFSQIVEKLTELEEQGGLC